ncbi:hypothetical protein BEWA_048510 [Theileria equi strain WA]|uniref:Uncharacterized protein n=1 Tax=Theileria equi strain WA TaxID=1537102 RepID=L1LAU3_THEEQ|nr:hypothetical protein BEWA_048510 [Theileria equi strain WA]EKX72384.1 hypothetical protein BEWA_048510 [Theileria equi strain WA]|eukprot:XP_004831836.1 hypothetical protein BEWA_048510 [Theileria equi strain WA]
MFGKGVTIDIGYSHHPLNPAEIVEYTYSYGGSSSDDVIVTETKNKSRYPGYIKCEHKPNNANTIGAIKYKDDDLTFENADISKYKNVTVYFWEWDFVYANPLLVKLGNGKYYATNDNKIWRDSTAFLRHGLIGFLDGMNCTLNKAHKIDILQRKQYKCLSTTCPVKIEVNPHGKVDNSEKYVQTIPEEPNGFRIGSITHGKKRLSNVDIPHELLESLSVFYHPGHTYLPVPLILEFEKSGSDVNYEYFNRSGTGWERTSIKLSQQDSQLPPDTRGQSSDKGVKEESKQYKDSKKVDKQEKENPPLVAQSPVSGREQVPGTEAGSRHGGGTHDTASVSGPKKVEPPVGGGKVSEGKGDEDQAEVKKAESNKNVEDSSGEQDVGSGLQEQGGIPSTKREAEHGAGNDGKTGPQGPAGGNNNESTPIHTQEGGSSDTTELPKILEDLITKYLPSNASEIAGGVFGGLVTVGTVGVTVWKWSSIMSFLITRL